MLGPDYRATASPSHLEFAPVYVEPEPSPGWKRIDGVKRLDHNGLFVFSKLYRVRVGTYPSGAPLYFEGTYVGNRRHIMDNNPSPELVGSTWQVFLQADPEDPETLECYRICDLEMIPDEGTVVVEANDYKPETRDFLAYYGAKCPPKPELGLKVTHPVHGGGEVVRLTGTGETWYADVEYRWPDETKAPSEGANVRRLVQVAGGAKHWVYGQVFEVVDGRVWLRFENESDDDEGDDDAEKRGHAFGIEEFYAQFRYLCDSASPNFYDVFGLDCGPRTMTLRLRRLKRDFRTHDERIKGASSRSSMALAALTARNTPDSGEFVRATRRGPWSPDMHGGFRWHRQRPQPPKNDSFAPLSGRKKSVGATSQGRPGDASLRAARAKLALEGPAPKVKPVPVRVRRDDGQDRDLIDLNGSIVQF
jgi:hypothetical protein